MSAGAAAAAVAGAGAAAAGTGEVFRFARFLAARAGVVLRALTGVLVRPVELVAAEVLAGVTVPLPGVFFAGVRFRLVEASGTCLRGVVREGAERAREGVEAFCGVRFSCRERVNGLTWSRSFGSSYLVGVRSIVFLTLETVSTFSLFDLVMPPEKPNLVGVLAIRSDMMLGERVVLRSQ